MKQVVRAYPLLEGREADLETFVRELKTTRGREAREFFGRFGVARESWHVQRTDHGTWVISVTEIPDRPVDAVREEFAASAVEFDKWFKSRVERLSGIDPDVTPLGPPTECIFDTRDLDS